MNKWPKKAQHRLVLEPHRAESSSPQVLHQADSLGNKEKSQTRDEFSPQQLECLHSHSLIAPFHFPVGNRRKLLPPVPCATGELPISLCSWERLLAVPGISPPQRGPWVPVLWETGAAGPWGAAGLLEEASCRCHDTSLICTASCRVPRHLPCNRMWGGQVPQEQQHPQVMVMVTMFVFLLLSRVSSSTLAAL